jgi:hypothetical protein
VYALVGRPLDFFAHTADATGLLTGAQQIYTMNQSGSTSSAQTPRRRLLNVSGV